MARTVRKVVRAGLDFDKKWHQMMLWKSHQADWGMIAVFIPVLGLMAAYAITAWFLVPGAVLSAFAIYAYVLCRQQVRVCADSAERAHRRQLRILEKAIDEEEAALNTPEPTPSPVDPKHYSDS